MCQQQRSVTISQELRVSIRLIYIIISLFRRAVSLFVSLSVCLFVEKFSRQLFHLKVVCIWLVVVLCSMAEFLMHKNSAMIDKWTDTQRISTKRGENFSTQTTPNNETKQNIVGANERTKQCWKNCLCCCKWCCMSSWNFSKSDQSDSCHDRWCDNGQQRGHTMKQNKYRFAH